MQMRHFAALALQSMRARRRALYSPCYRDWHAGNAAGATLMLVAFGPWVGSEYDTLRESAKRLK